MARKTVAANIAFDDVKNRYYVTLRCGRDDQGVPVRRSRCLPTLEQALAVRDSLRSARSAGEVPPSSGVTVGGWLDYWLNDVIRPTRAATTVYGYQKIIDNHIRPLLGGVPLQGLSAAQIQQYMARKQQEGLGANTIRKHYVLLSSVMNLAVRQGFLAKNPVRAAAPPPQCPPQHRFYTPEQLQRLFALTAGRSLEPVVKLAGCLGMRRSEICALKWGNVDLEREVVYVCEARTAVSGVAVDKGPKSPSSVRWLSFAGNADLSALLRSMHNSFLQNREKFGESYNPLGFVVTHSQGKPYSPDYLSGYFSRFVREAGLPACTLHGLRHSFASIANSRQVPMFSISKALGHSSTSVTSQIYTHLFDDTHQEVVQLVGQAISEGKEDTAHLR